jgi:hypothetical protein
MRRPAEPLSPRFAVWPPNEEAPLSRRVRRPLAAATCSQMQRCGGPEAVSKETHKTRANIAYNSLTFQQVTEPVSRRDARARISDRLGNDLNNALMAIQTHAEVLAKLFPDNVRVQEATAVICAAVRRAADSVNEVRAELDSVI